ncbi:MAG: sigma-70 family RNA polymerase sigma factor [Gemmataceae bacterium]|nr:sigma-70 family RNA polymerase sigma factor [Gemmataceae bacterium]
MGTDDQELIRRWQRGDAASFAALVRRWQQPVARFLTHFLGRTDLVQDLCQEVFLRVHHAGPQYREAAAFSTWLYRIALNVARDTARRQHKMSPLQAYDPPARGLSPEAACEQRELADAVAQAVAELPERLRVVLVLHHYEGMNFEQIARLTQTPASTVKSRFAAALQRLRVRLQELGWGLEEAEE